MPFTLKRPNASRFDLPQDRLELYNRAQELARAYGKQGIFREGVLVNLLMQYANGDKVLLCIDRFCARQMTSLDHLVDMIEGRRPLEFVQSQPGQERAAPARERSGAAGPIKAGDFLASVATSEAKPARDPYVMREHEARAWMLKHHSGELLDWEEFFVYAGVDQHRQSVFSLKKEYRTNANS